MAFAELLAHSNFSFLEGASHPEELATRAAELGLAAVALCDRDGLYGSARMHAAARASGVRVIVGAELTLADTPARATTAPAPAAPPRSLALLAEDHTGYSNLCRLLTRAHAGQEKGTARIALAEVARNAEGLVAVVPSELEAPGQPPRLDDAELGLVHEAFGERAALAVWRHKEPGDEARISAARAASARSGLGLVASARPRWHDRARKPLGDVLCCIRHGTTLDAAGRLLAPNAEAVLRSEAEMARLFPRERAWLERAAALAARCRFSLSEVRYRFPCDYGGEPNETLRARVAVGAAARYPEGVPASVRGELDRELALIALLEVAPYFLSVLEVVEIARARGILCQGRGSAANSAVCFVLGITAVDPAKSSLLFERFMSSERREPPDIDVDFEHERREEVIQEIYRRYGRDRAAMVSEVICYRGKMALREVGKAFGLSEEQLGRLASIASHFYTDRGGRDEDGEATALPTPSRAALTRRGLDPADARLAQVLRLAAELEGVPRHLSIHVGGFVLSAEPLERVAPIEPGRMPGRTVIPWDKDDIDALGFFKVDVLGLGMLTAVRKALALVHGVGAMRARRAAHPAEGETAQRHAAEATADPILAAGARGEVFDPIAALARVPPEDPLVYDACSRADTVGVFQIESRAQMAMLPLLRPRKFYDLVVEVGIVRPGPIQGKMVHPYLRRRTGEEPVTYPHACLEPILERTLGVPLFQEQVMQIAIVGAGYSGGEADQLRRDMAAWKKHGRLARHKDKLLAGFARRGISHEFGARLYQQIMGFGEYGFPESHAASFALIVYASAWLKVHHPAAFVCALVNAQPMGFYTPGSLVRDAQAHGVTVRPVRVEASDWDCTLEAASERERQAASATRAGPARDRDLCVRLGLRLVAGLGKESGERVVAVRAERRARGVEPPFASVDDFAHATGLRQDELDRLASAGALEGIEPERREALWRIRAPRAPGLFEDRAIERDERAGLPPLAGLEQLALDYGTVGLSLHDHPMRHLRRSLARRRVRLARDAPSWKAGERVTVAGVVLTRQRPATASGVVFITLEDETGTVNLVLYAHVFEAHELVARHAGLLLARGRVDRRGEVVHVRVSGLERLDLPRTDAPTGGLAVRSRDFH
ncbi:MAG: error-prone DNA polymerase [Myxococcales bacterium]|nr:error-prone DNA polymerase [Myxococcales bacterium]